MTLEKTILLILLLRRRKIRRIDRRGTSNRPLGVILTNRMINQRFMCRQFLRMEPETFEGIVQIATPHLNLSYIGNKEAIAIFIHFVGMNEPIIAQCHLFGLSNTIIQKAKYQTADAIIKGFCAYFSPNSKLWRRSMLYIPPYEEFIGVLGAIDGTHIAVRVPAEKCDEFRNRKNFVSTNVLIFCNFRQEILYMRTNIPGSHHDSPVYSRNDY